MDYFKAALTFRLNYNKLIRSVRYNLLDFLSYLNTTVIYRTESEV